MRGQEHVQVSRGLEPASSLRFGVICRVKFFNCTGDIGQDIGHFSKPDSLDVFSSYIYISILQHVTPIFPL